MQNKFVKQLIYWTKGWSFKAMEVRGPGLYAVAECTQQCPECG
jgi:hypothetical protein